MSKWKRATKTVGVVITATLIVVGVGLSERTSLYSRGYKAGAWFAHEAIISGHTGRTAAQWCGPNHPRRWIQGCEAAYNHWS